MSMFLSTNHASLQHSVSTTVEALFAETSSEIEFGSVSFTRAAAVGVTGEQTATVVVRVDDEIARRYAASMFGVGAAEVTDIDILDSLLELTNVLGGAAKTALTSDCALTLPRIVAVAELPTEWADEAAFAIAGGAVSVTLIPGDLPGA